MNVLDCINNKRSGRAYTEQKISDEVISELLTLGTKASTGSGLEPWGFVVIRDRAEIEKLSEQAKAYILKNFDQYPYLKQYETWLTKPGYSIFNNAGCLIIIYGNTESHWFVYDCTLAAGNIMLAAHSMAIGTCWIGFAEHICNTKEFKEQYGVPDNYELVCPMSVGYMKGTMRPPVRKEPVIFNK